MNNVSSIKLPVNWKNIWDNHAISFFLVENTNSEQTKVVITKHLISTVDGSVEWYIMNNKIKLEQIEINKICYPFAITHLIDIIKVLHDKHICTGGSSSDNFPGNYSIRRNLVDCINFIYLCRFIFYNCWFQCFRNNR